eukprot:symbB.v1.2.016040.t1/scaffold1212.1/size131235/6
MRKRNVTSFVVLSSTTRTSLQTLMPLPRMKRRKSMVPGTCGSMSLTLLRHHHQWLRVRVLQLLPFSSDRSWKSFKRR